MKKLNTCNKSHVPPMAAAAVLPNLVITNPAVHPLMAPIVNCFADEDFRISE